MFEQTLSFIVSMYGAIGPGIILMAALPVFGFLTLVLLRESIRRARATK